MKDPHKKSSISFLMIVVMLGPCYAVICPNLASISPCGCSDAIGISIDCNFKNLADSQIGPILNAFLAPGLSTVVKIMAKGNQLTKVPSQISKFPYLEMVDLSNNRISAALNNGAAFISNATFGIVEISLSSNQITSIPSGVFLFSFASSVTIDLNDNQISSISSDAFRFPSALRVSITFRNNQISVLPDGIFNYPSATEYVMIFLKRNKITAMPSSAVFNFPISNYVHVDLGENAITSIPCTSQLNFPRAGNLVGINLGYNQISTVPSCAFNFPIARTVAIDLMFNSITTISPGAFNFPLALSIGLTLNNNQISVIPPNTFSQGNYISISLGNNQLKRLESSVFKSLLIRNNPTMMDIRGNPIDCLTDPCHLTWFLRGTNIAQFMNRNFFFANGVCSNGGDPPFSTLNSFDFNNTCTCACH